VELLVQLREAAEAEAIKIFGRNLHELLLAAPAGPKAVLGLDPGIRTGCKVAVVDVTGKLLDDAGTVVNFLGTTTSKQDAYNRKAEKSISGQVHGGGPLLRVHTGSGDISIE
jgi:transcriptional accessory protein Tex/SPT6